jgi:hypothetical protein
MLIFSTVRDDGFHLCLRNKRPEDFLVKISKTDLITVISFGVVEKFFKAGRGPRESLLYVQQTASLSR